MTNENLAFQNIWNGMLKIERHQFSHTSALPFPLMHQEYGWISFTLVLYPT